MIYCAYLRIAIPLEWMVDMHEYSEVSDEIICALGAAAGEDAVLIAEPMSAHTTFKIGGPADVVVEPRSIEGVVGALNV